MPDNEVKKFSPTLISFNTMSAFSFDSVHGFLESWNPVARLKKTADILSHEDSDIVALQEVHSYHALNILRKRLKNYKYVIYKKFIYGPRGGLVVFSKYPVEKMDYVNFKKRGSFFNSSFIAHVIRNGLLVCRLKDLPYAILNVHATPNLDHDDSKNNRFIKYIDAQLHQISELTKKLRAEGLGIILAGDLNVAKESYSYNNFIKQSGLRDVFGEFNTPTQHQEYLPKKKRVKRIDYILASDPQDLLSINSVEHLFVDKYIIKKRRQKFLSDHIGLKAKLIFKH